MSDTINKLLAMLKANPKQPKVKPRPAKIEQTKIEQNSSTDTLTLKKKHNQNNEDDW